MAVDNSGTRFHHTLSSVRSRSQCVHQLSRPQTLQRFDHVLAQNTQAPPASLSMWGEQSGVLLRFSRKDSCGRHVAVRTSFSSETSHRRSPGNGNLGLRRAKPCPRALPAVRPLSGCLLHRFRDSHCPQCRHCWFPVCQEQSPSPGLACLFSFPGRPCGHCRLRELSAPGAALSWTLSPDSWLGNMVTAPRGPGGGGRTLLAWLRSGHRYKQRGFEGPGEGAVSSRRARPKQEALVRPGPCSGLVPGVVRACQAPPPASPHPPSSPQDEAGRECERRGPGRLRFGPDEAGERILS